MKAWSSLAYTFVRVFFPCKIAGIAHDPDGEVIRPEPLESFEFVAVIADDKLGDIEWVPIYRASEFPDHPGLEEVTAVVIDPPGTDAVVMLEALGWECSRLRESVEGLTIIGVRPMAWGDGEAH